MNLAPGVKATDVTIDGNLFTSQGGRGSKASGAVTSATATDTFSFDFCDALVFDNITFVRHSFTQGGAAGSGKPSSFPVSVATAVTACDDASQNKRVNVYLSEPAIGM